MMRSSSILLILLLLGSLPCISTAQQSAVLVIVDGMGASYLYPELSAECVDGSLLEQVQPGIIGDASARYTLSVPVPQTEYGHAVIVTGYSGADDETLTYYDGTIFDSLRKEGYWCIGVLETGDTANMVKELDAVVHDSNNSIYAPALLVNANDGRVPAEMTAILEDNPQGSPLASKDKAAAYKRYDDWSLDKAVQLVNYLNSSCPGQKYLLIINVAGPDSAAHASGFYTYRTALAGLDPGLSRLAAACDNPDTVLVVTADHGMSFKSLDSKGSHGSDGVADRNESRLVPLLIFNDGATGSQSNIYGQECVAPTLLSLMGCPNSMSMCDGEAMPWNDRPALQLEAAGPTNATISGPGGFLKTVVINSTLRMAGLEPGDYRVESNGRVQAVSLTHDTIVRLRSDAQAESELPAFALFLGAGVLAAAGIAAAMLWKR